MRERGKEPHVSAAILHSCPGFITVLPQEARNPRGSQKTKSRHLELTRFTAGPCAFAVGSGSCVRTWVGSPLFLLLEGLVFLKVRGLFFLWDVGSTLAPVPRPSTAPAHTCSHSLSSHP